jgi:hypothetical protein
MEPIYQTINLPTGTRYKLRPLDTIMNPTMCGITDARPVAQDSPRPRRAIHNVNISVDILLAADISSTQKVICKVPFHVFTGGSPNSDVCATPIVDSAWKRVQWDRQGYGGFNYEVQVRRQ